ncbi:hypothetical protein [Streptomyces vietnamensis]|uniref:Uncharacterized protein n=1 Tax=Streptomyces vietnamensis TaxID=362257 RepID=A0A0B5I8X7_9ACTN|nr:hypothetical protein [Streptomyces vietnamensis]AJF70485.1 hypothetical protein SVTN_40740 [Streptomyces vietnamensis]
MDPFVTYPDHPACGICPSRRLRREGLDAAAGTHLIRADIAEELGYPEPREEDGLYGIGGWEWTWSISTWDCACSSWYYHETDPCPNCGGERPNGFELAA